MMLFFPVIDLKVIKTGVDFLFDKFMGDLPDNEVVPTNVNKVHIGKNFKLPVSGGKNLNLNKNALG
jgi:hypothetical protein